MDTIATRSALNTPARSTPGSRTLAAGVALVLALAVAKLLLHLATTGRFGYDFFVDELYYLALAEHLAWGFVDVPPLFPALTALVRALLGDSLLAVRLVPALAGAGLVLATGLFARRLGGKTAAMGLAALGVLAAPVFLAMHSFHTMNALEPLFWLAAAWLLVRLLDGEDPRLWLAFGAVAGLGLLNKHSMAFFGVALVVGLAATPARRAFRERWIWLGGLVAFAIFLPNLIWVASHGFPHFQVLAQVAEDGRNVSLSPWAFLAQQVLMVHPLALPLWLGGLVFLLWSGAGSRWRPLGLAFLVALALMFLLDGRVYYLAPAYPMLLAAGGVALERGARQLARGWALPAYAGVLAVGGVALAPLFVPLLPPETLIRYSEATGLTQPRIENHRLGPLPQLHADRFGWREMAAEVARVYRSLPPEEQAVAVVFGQNYGQAGAIDLFGPELGLPKAISGHLAYHDWGPRSSRGEVVIVMDDDRETLERLFEQVEWAGRVEHPYSMPYQHFDLHVCRRLRMPIEELWPQVRKWR
ncbi:MAG TPA: glycosyltransferase family 39 protein [Thermoanaerobaculia bacterium]|nr:glycosyltransferase family 39 protein [Thermoanaerobaculia bacterium]